MKEKNCRRGHGMEADPWHGMDFSNHVHYELYSWRLHIRKNGVYRKCLSLNSSHGCRWYSYATSPSDMEAAKSGGYSMLWHVSEARCDKM